MEMNIRRANANDYNSMCVLFDETDRLHRDHLPHIFQEPSGEGRQGYYLSLIADENVALWVAEAGGKVVGFVQAIIRDTAAIPVLVPRRYAIVDSIVVKSGYQRQGIGGRLMDKAQEWAIVKGATSIELNVYEFNESAITFYEGLGYQTLSRKMHKELEQDREI